VKNNIFGGALDRLAGKGRGREMVSLNIDEVSGVDHPANLLEGFAVMKSAECTGPGCVTCHILGGCQCDDPEACAR
jgi:hypothetical protein